MTEILYRGTAQYCPSEPPPYCAICGEPLTRTDAVVAEIDPQTSRTGVYHEPCFEKDDQP